MKSDYDYYNLVEKCLLEVTAEGAEEVVKDTEMVAKLSINDVVQKIKALAMELSRNKPTDWNKFMDVIVI